MKRFVTVRILIQECMRVFPSENRHRIWSNCLYAIVLISAGCTNRNENLLTMENAPWGDEYQAYFKDLESKGILIRDRNDSSIYRGTWDKDSIIVVVNGLRWPSKKLLLVEIFLGNCYGDKSYGGIDDNRKYHLDANSDSIEYTSGYGYTRKATIPVTLFNTCKDLYTKRYGQPIVTESSNMFAPKGAKKTIRNRWKRSTGMIRGNYDSSFSMIYSDLPGELHKIRDSLSKTLRPREIVKVNTGSSPDINFVGNECTLGVSISGINRLDYYFDESIIGVQFDLVFKDDFDNEIFRIRNLQTKIGADGLGNHIESGFIVVVPDTQFKLNAVFSPHHIEYTYLLGIKNSGNVHPPQAIVTGVLFEGGKVVKD